MTLVKWNPVADYLPQVSHLNREINRMFDSFFRGGSLDDGSYGSAWAPAVDIHERDDAYVIEAELPGLAKEDIKVSIENNVLTLRGERSSEKKDHRGEYLRMERSYGSFVRSFTLPTTIKSEKAEAEYRDGILTITVPKADEAKPRNIDLKVS